MSSSLSLQSPLVAIPLFATVAFMVVGNPVVYKFTDSKIGAPLKMPFLTASGMPTRPGLIVHAIVLGLILYAYLRAYSPEAAYY